ncbi:WRKY transcription factor 44 isoform X2 [Morus notabilis]|uniref:WRKY transcription factor 44 isoform X2 n=1 Tax=Morus notabilis TaxID=981085 RepID=UPI000CED483C|nr:WRKY transcription factor 44 isoform X2 [Morus notabilis]
MDVKEAERTVIAKPVASRPSSSSFRSFTELLAGAINATPSNTSSETAVPAIRPKTVRFKPVVHRTAAGLISSQVEISGAAVCNPSDKSSKPDGKLTVVHKPLAKVVSKTTVSLLANMGNFNNTNQPIQSSFEPQVQYPYQDKHTFRSQMSSSPHQNFPSRAETSQRTETSKMVSTSENHEEDLRSLPSMGIGDRPSYDGYNWRKYGQKQVKGSEFPRSYYKCTHPNCPVKKKVERSLDGQIAEIVYKGEHNHSKPQPPKRGSHGTQGLGLGSDTTGQDTNSQLWNSQLNERIEGFEGRLDNQNETLSLQSYQSRAQQPHDSLPTVADNSRGPSVEPEEESKGLEAEDDEPKSKRRKGENQSSEAGTSGEAMQESQVVVQNSSDPEISGDGFRWRKYGQKKLLQVHESEMQREEARGKSIRRPKGFHHNI